MILEVCPPSPAFSACDSIMSLDGDALDAWLEAQGPLSRFGTPPMHDKQVMTGASEVLKDRKDVSEDEAVVDCKEIMLAS
jgi:hypothetical protein